MSVIAFLERVFHKLLLEFHLVGESERHRRAKTSSRADSWASTTSGFSTAAHPCRPAATSNSLMATSWMGMYCLNMLSIALELARENRAYEDVASKFFEHFVYICRAMNNIGAEENRVMEQGGRIFLRRPASSRRTDASLEGALTGRVDPALCG